MKRLEITKVESFRSKYDDRFSGTIRNQFDFNIGEKVYIECRGKMMQCEIIGKEKTPTDNADWFYKIEIPNVCDSPVDIDTISLTCDRIFKSKEDAKYSAMKHLERMYELDKENLEKFFTKE